MQSMPFARRFAAAVFLPLLLLATASFAQPCVDLNAAGPIPATTSFTIDGIDFNAAFIAPSTGNLISVEHVYPFGAPDAAFDVWVPWSENNLGGNQFAEIVFTPAVYGAGVDMVEIKASHQNFLEFQAFDSGGAPLGLPLIHTAGSGNLQTFTMNFVAPIARVEIRGSEIALTSVCYQPTGPVPARTYIDIAGLPTGLTAPEIVVDRVVFRAGVVPAGTVIDLFVDDNFDFGGNGVNEINVPWSQVDAPAPARFAKILFPPADFGVGPMNVEVKGAHLNALELRAYDRFGVLVDVRAHTLGPDVFEWLPLTSATGIRRIDIVGAEIGIEELCYEAGPPSTYASADPYPRGASAHLFTVNGVEFEAAFDPAGAPLNLMVDDALAPPSGDGTHEFFVGWSMPGVGASVPARVRFPAAQFGDGPTSVEVLCAPSVTLDLIAYDKVGNVIDTKTHTAGALVLQPLLLSGGNIREIEVVGTQLWIQEICWEGGDIPPPVDPTYIDFAGVGAFVGPTLTVGGAVFTAGVTPGGAVADLFTADNFDFGGNGIPELNVPWSELNAPAPARYARILFPAGAFGKGPIQVQLKSSHTNFLSMEAHDRFGALVDVDVHTQPQQAWDLLVLNNAGGIRYIDIIGSEIGIEEICYELGPDPCEEYADASSFPIGDMKHVFTDNDMEVHGWHNTAGTPMDVVITDNLPAAGSDGVGEFFIGYSVPAPAPEETAKIVFPAAKFGSGPDLVEVTCAPSTTLELRAYDDGGALLGTAVHTAGALVPETLVFSTGSAAIRTIEIVGTQCWILEVCWSGRDIVSAGDGPAVRAGHLAVLQPPAPNPFNPMTQIRFELTRAETARIDVIDLRGRVVRTLTQRTLSAGTHQVQWDGTDGGGQRVASGVYVIRLQAGLEVHTQRATLVK